LRSDHPATARVGIGIAEADRIDRDNILAATLWAMARGCCTQLGEVALALVDGNRAPDLSCSVDDRRRRRCALRCRSPAASVIAKVTRDRIMVGA
jgi:ribonuclease HII